MSIIEEVSNNNLCNTGQVVSTVNRCKRSKLYGLCFSASEELDWYFAKYLYDTI